MNQTEDEQWIRRVRAGDTRAYAYLVDKYQGLAYTLAFRVLKHTQEAEEASQDAFVRAYRGLATYQGEASFSTWLYRIVYNTALSRLRKKKMTMISIEQDHSLRVSESDGAFQTLQQQDQQAFIEQALQKLPGDEAALVDLYYIQEKNTEEVGQITGLTRANVRTKLFRIRKKLYQHLSKLVKNGKEDLL